MGGLAYLLGRVHHIVDLSALADVLGGLELGRTGFVVFGLGGWVGGWMGG